jgi:hypothetical protein
VWVMKRVDIKTAGGILLNRLNLMGYAASRMKGSRADSGI